MKFSYAAFFYPEEEEGICVVTVPSMTAEFIVEPEPFSITNIVESARRELEEIVYTWLQEEEYLPDDWTGDDKGYAFTAQLEGDTDEAAKRIISVKEFDLS